MLYANRATLFNRLLKSILPPIVAVFGSVYVLCKSNPYFQNMPPHPVSVATRLLEGVFLVNSLKKQRQEGKGQLT